MSDADTDYWRIQAADVLTQLHEAEKENAQLRAEIQHRAQIDAEDTHRLQAYVEDIMRAGDLEHARMAALVEACADFAAWAEAYTPDSRLARAVPAFYGRFRTYGQVARAAVAAVRPQADAFVARLADLSRSIGEQNTTIGYQDAMLVSQRKTLEAAYHALQSYACGNSAPALAEEVAAEIARVIGKEPGT